MVKAAKLIGESIVDFFMISKFGAVIGTVLVMAFLAAIPFIGSLISGQG